MKKHTFLVILSFLIFSAPAFVFAAPKIPVSTVITNYLHIGSTDTNSHGQVTTLQNFLMSQGYLKIDASNGIFGKATRGAVLNFQKANNIPVIGAVGPLTRTVINQIDSTGAVASDVQTSPIVVAPEVIPGASLNAPITPLSSPDVTSAPAQTFSLNSNDQPAPVIACPSSPVGDINGDGVVDHTDLNLLAKAYGTSLGNPDYNPCADINKDNSVNFSDLLLVAQNFSTTTFLDLIRNAYDSSSGSGSNYKSIVDFNHDGVVNFSDLLILAQCGAVDSGAATTNAAILDCLYDHTNHPFASSSGESPDASSSIPAVDPTASTTITTDDTSTTTDATASTTISDGTEAGTTSTTTTVDGSGSQTSGTSSVNNTSDVTSTSSE